MPNESSGRQQTEDTKQGSSSVKQDIVAQNNKNESGRKAAATPDLEKDVHWTIRASFWSQVGLGLIGLIALVIYYCQLTEMKKATTASAQAAYAACLSAQIANQTLNEIRAGGGDTHSLALGSIAQAVAVTRGEAAQIKFSPPPGSPGFSEEATGPIIHLGSGAMISNIGKTAALRVRGRMKVVVEDGGKEPNFIYDNMAEGLHTGAINSEDPPYPLSTYVGNGKKIRDFTRDEVLEIQKAVTKRLFIYARITYFDIFGVQHWAQFCQMASNIPHRATSIPKCAAYNKTDINQVVPNPKKSPTATQNSEDITCKKPE